MKTIARIIIAGLCLILSVNLSGQGFSVYLHTDRHSYFEGDTILFRTYIINDNNSNSVSAQDTLFTVILDQFGLEVADRSFSPDNLASGKLNLPDNLSEGNYILVAYTSQMKYGAPEQMFSRILEIRKASGNYLSTELSLSDSIYTPGGTLKAQVRFSGKDNIPVPASFSYQLNGKEEEILSGNGKANSDGIATLKMRLPKFDGKEILELAVDPSYKGTKHSTGVIIPTKFNLAGNIPDRINYNYSPETKHLNIQINPGNLQPGTNEKGFFEISVADENGDPVTASLSVSVAGIAPHQQNSESDNLFGFIHQEPNHQQETAGTDLKTYFARYLNQKIQRPGSTYIIQEKNNLKKLHKKVSAAGQSIQGSNTLFWSPAILTGKDGKATVSFSNSVKASEVLISIDGIAANGMAGSASYRFVAK